MCAPLVVEGPHLRVPINVVTRPINVVTRPINVVTRQRAMRETRR